MQESNFAAIYGRRVQQLAQYAALCPPFFDNRRLFAPMLDDDHHRTKAAARTSPTNWITATLSMYPNSLDMLAHQPAELAPSKPHSDQHTGDNRPVERCGVNQVIAQTAIHTDMLHEVRRRNQHIENEVQCNDLLDNRIKQRMSVDKGVAGNAGASLLCKKGCKSRNHLIYTLSCGA